jgi:DNA ligase D-like protein (predicted ligase)
VGIGGIRIISANKQKAAFVKPMLLLPTKELPESPEWTYELKLDGFRAIAIKTDRRVQLRSKNNKDFNNRYSGIVKALAPLPDDTVIDGEIVALDASGRPSFNGLQNYRSTAAPIFYFVFDLPMLSGQQIMSEPLSKRRELLRQYVLPRLADPVKECPELSASLSDVIESVRRQRLEGVVAKRLNSLYEPGERSGAWRKMRLNQESEFVIGGYTVGARTLDAVVFGYYEDGKLLYAGRTRNGFIPSLREQLHKQLHAIKVSDCPFANLPERAPGRWGEGLTAAKMKECQWVKPILVAKFEFVEWTPDNHLRHSGFVGVREGVNPFDVRREA